MITLAHEMDWTAIFSHDCQQEEKFELRRHVDRQIAVFWDTEIFALRAHAPMRASPRACASNGMRAAASDDRDADSVAEQSHVPQVIGNANDLVLHALGHSDDVPRHAVLRSCVDGGGDRREVAAAILGDDGVDSGYFLSLLQGHLCLLRCSMPQRLHAWLLWHMTIWTRLQFLATTGSRRKILSFVVSWNGRSRTKKFCPYPKGTCPHARKRWNMPSRTPFLFQHCALPGSSIFFISISKTLNCTDIVLIPKKTYSNQDYKVISLTNVAYPIIAKSLANW